MMKAYISDIKRFAVHDGDGIRTTVFLKGCPLRCVWCHNPEGLSAVPQLAYYSEKCVGCGECTRVCPFEAHTMSEAGHIFHREKCTGCGTCEAVCFHNALKFYGREMTVDELLPLLLEDREFYENSNGGVTISGGECLVHPHFCAQLLKALKQENINTAVDTCGFVSRSSFELVIPYTDVFLYDIKAFEEAVHIRCTGQSNTLILENLKYLDSLGKKIEVRIPYVPGYNSGEIPKIAEFLSGLKNIIQVRILPYHNYAASKYDALGISHSLPKTIPTEDEINTALQFFRSSRYD